MTRCDGRQFGIRLDSRHLRLVRRHRFGQCRHLRPQLLRVTLLRLVTLGNGLFEFGQCLATFLETIAVRRQRIPLVVVAGHPVDQAVKSRQFGNRFGRIRFGVQEIAVPLDDHPELGTPVPHVVVGRDTVALEPEHPGQGVADDSAAKMADMHRLGNVGARIIDDHVARCLDGMVPQPGIGQHP